MYLYCTVEVLVERVLSRSRLNSPALPLVSLLYSMDLLLLRYCRW